MAYMSQPHKKEIATLLKAIIPGTWKYSLRVRDYSTLILTIKSAPDNLLAECHSKRSENSEYVQVNTYNLNSGFSGNTLQIMTKIVAAMNDKNHDRSDSQTDYFDVGHYIAINIGTYETPFVIK